MNIIKGKGQRLIPEELLKYLEAFKEAHPDPTQGGGATLDDIVDSQGNKRFVEGNGTPAEISGVTPVYCKWTLSGTHLMLVYTGTVNAATSSVPISYRYLADFTLPDFILNKIVGDNIESKFVTFYFSSQTMNLKCNLSKRTDKLSIYFDANKIFDTYNYSFRIQFDLIIDVS